LYFYLDDQSRSPDRNGILFCFLGEMSIDSKCSESKKDIVDSGISSLLF